MKEFIIFLIIFLIVFCASVFIFNGRFLYAQIKYAMIGMPPISTVLYESKETREEVYYPEKLIIPAIGVEAPVIIAESDNEKYLQGLLERGTILLPGSFALNQKGVAVIMGHSSAYPWYKGQYGSVFALLNKLNLNDEIIVFSKNKKFTYRVLEKQIKAPKNLVFEKQENESILYLVSCWPINTAWERIVIKTTIDKD